MSYHTWSIDGYGFSVARIETTATKVRELLSYAPKFNNKIREDLMERGITNPKLGDYLSYDEVWCSGLAYIIQETISEAEDIQLDIASNFDDEWYVLFCPSYPWSNISNKEKCLTQESLTKIFSKYIKILTDNQIYINFQSVENGG